MLLHRILARLHTPCERLLECVKRLLLLGLRFVLRLLFGLLICLFLLPAPAQILNSLPARIIVIKLD